MHIACQLFVIFDRSRKNLTFHKKIVFKFPLCIMARLLSQLFYVMISILKICKAYLKV